ncbi:MAG: hypothetical protein P8Y70_14550 [Candidatus Lokiarchaeota archaeon]
MISKVLEIEVEKEDLIKALYIPEVWEAISPVKKITVDFPAPNVLRSEIYDEVDLVKIPIKLSGELVMTDQGEDPGKGRLIELNVRNNKDVKHLEGRLRIKKIGSNKSKVGVFIHNFELNSEFLNILGDASELVLRNKLSDLMRNLQKYCMKNDLKSII